MLSSLLLFATVIYYHYFINLCSLQIQSDLQYIKEDINSVERHRMELYRARDKYSLKLRMLGDDPTIRKPWSSSTEKHSGGFISSSHNSRAAMSSDNLHNRKMEEKPQGSSQGFLRKDTLSGSESQHLNQSSLAVARKKRVHAQVSGHFTLSVSLSCYQTFVGLCDEHIFQT